jgi:hypothetical protein
MRTYKRKSKRGTTHEETCMEAAKFSVKAYNLNKSIWYEVSEFYEAAEIFEET